MRTNMTKADLVAEIADRTGISKIEAQQAVETFMQVVKESIVSGASVELRGFGTFFPKKRAAKTARNISKGTTIVIPEHEVPAFKPSKIFANSLKDK